MVGSTDEVLYQSNERKTETLVDVTKSLMANYKKEQRAAVAEK